jgi:hypothetical protein
MSPERRLSCSPWNFGGGPPGDQAASSLVGVTAMVASWAARRGAVQVAVYPAELLGRLAHPTSRAMSSASIAWSTCRPVPPPGPAAPRGRGRPARPGRWSPARAAGAWRGRWWCGGYPSARRSPSGRATWRMPDTYRTAGLRRGPPPQLLREPGQPPGTREPSNGLTLRRR